ncbi:MAG: hypothetical protein GY936_01060 [Ignavibacteriae bacterium]|nr:hypothetical protein [Ignavibacteriota bacterium]
MKHFAFLFTVVIFLTYPLFIAGQRDTDNKYLVSAPKIKGLSLNIISPKSEIRIEEEATFLLEIKALYDVKNIIVTFNYSMGLKVNENMSVKEIARIDSGKMETIPFSAITSEKTRQNIRIEVLGVLDSKINNIPLNFRKGKEIGILYNEKTKTFIMETEFEAMSNSYRIWNLVPEDTLLARGHEIVYKQTK